MLTVLSWGVGLQSTTLLEMSACGDLPKLDAAIFADTGFEHDYSYEIYDYYAPRARAAGIEVIKIGGQDIFGDHMVKVSAPMFVVDGDRRGRQINRSCTRDYKIRPIQRQVRDLLGVKRRGRLAADLVELWLGITVDEISRAKDSRVGYIRHQFPLLDLAYKRGDCETYLRGKGLPVPEKSACKFCPYQQPREWRQKSDQEISLIADLENHINYQQLIRLRGRAKTVSFSPDGLPQADSSPSPQADFFDACDGGFCNL